MSRRSRAHATHGARAPTGTPAGPGAVTPSLSAPLAPLVPHLAFALLGAGTWRRWVLPFQDSGREMLVASRLADGETLYRDVAYYYGPLPAQLDALAFRLLGQHLDVLVALRTLVALAGLEALRRLVLRLVRDPPASSAIATFVVAACFFCWMGGAYPFPYSTAALEGTVGTWIAVELALGSAGAGRSLAAALVAGLAAGTKLEVFPAAVAGVGIALLIRRPRKEAIAATSFAGLLGLAAYAIPVHLHGVGVLERQGFLLALRLPAETRRLYAQVFWGGGDAGTFPARLLTDLVVPSAVFLGLAFLAARRAPNDGPVTTAFLLGIGLASAAVPGNREIHLLVPASVVVVAWEAFRACRDPSRDRLLAAAPVLAVGGAMLPALARQPFALGEAPYSAFSAPLPLAVSLSWLVLRVGPSKRVVALIAGLACAQGFDHVAALRRVPTRLVSFPRGSLRLYGPEADLLEDAVEAARTRTPPGSYIVVAPEAGTVLFLSERRCPFPDEGLLPGMHDAAAELALVRLLDDKPPAAAIIVNRSYREYGAGRFGVDYLRRLRSELDRRMVVAATLGRPGAGGGFLPYPARADAGVLLLPASPRKP